LVELGYDLGPTGADGIYGQKTWNAVQAFKKNEQLGWEQMGDVGPGTMARLDGLFPAATVPAPPPITPDGPVAVGESFVCGGVEREGGGQSTGGADELTGPVERRQSFIFPLTIGPTPPCPALDFSMFKGPPNTHTRHAAASSSWLELNGNAIEAKFYGNR